MISAWKIASRNCCTDSYQILFSLIMLVAAFYSLFGGFRVNELPVVSMSVIILTDAFVISLIHCAAIRSTPRSWAPGESGREPWPGLPTRPSALLIIFILLLSLVVAFGDIYIWTCQIKGLSNPLDALYFSSVTVTTLGYGDFSPTVDSVSGKWTVMAELFSGLVLLIAGFPLLIGRLAMWNDEREEEMIIGCSDWGKAVGFYTLIAETLGYKTKNSESNLIQYIGANGFEFALTVQPKGSSQHKFNITFSASEAQLNQLSSKLTIKYDVTSNNLRCLVIDGPDNRRVFVFCVADN